MKAEISRREPFWKIVELNDPEPSGSADTALVDTEQIHHQMTVYESEI